MYTIKTLNNIAPAGLAKLGPAQFKVDNEADAPQGILVRSAKMHEMELPESLLAIGRAGAGVNNIPVEKCSEAGVVVFNTPGANAGGVAELTIGGLVLASRNLLPAMEWAQGLAGEGDAVPALVEKGKSQFVGPELAGKKLGVVGLGAIGVKVANAAVHLGMEVYGYDPYLSVDAALSLSRMVHHVTDLTAIYVLREITGMSMEDIGKEFGGRDHSTVVYAIKVMEKDIAADQRLRETVEDIIKNVRA